MTTIARKAKPATKPAAAPAPYATPAPVPKVAKASKPTIDKIVPAKQPVLMVRRDDDGLSLSIILGRGQLMVEHIELTGLCKHPGYTMEGVAEYDAQWKLPAKSFNPSGTEVPSDVVQCAFHHLNNAGVLGIPAPARAILQLITKGKTMKTNKQASPTKAAAPTSKVAPKAAQKPAAPAAKAPAKALTPAQSKAQAAIAAVEKLKASAAKAPAKPVPAVAQKAASKAPTKPPIANITPKAEPAPAKGKAAKATPAPAPAKGKAVAAKPNKAKEPDTTTYKVGDDSAIKRGVVREFVDKAKELKKFQRDTLVAAMAKQYGEERMVRYFYYCTGHGVIVPA